MTLILIQNALEDITLDSLPPDWHTYPLVYKKIKAELAGILNSARSEIKKQVINSHIQLSIANKMFQRSTTQH